MDFHKRALIGDAVLCFIKINPNAKFLILDVKDIRIQSIKDETTGGHLKFNFGAPNQFGEKLVVQIPTTVSKKGELRISYKTSPKSKALTWLSPPQTAGKKYPYMFSMAPTIHARTIFPCQDTPSVKTTFSAAITAPKNLTVLMSATRARTKIIDDKRVSKFKQQIPVMSYLIAIAVGAIESRRIGPRSQVWSEAELIEKAAFDFSETDEMIKTAEQLCGPYEWKIFDILVLPPSFIYGGMENPCMSFLSPTALSGDKSNADVIAHDIVHSWAGNLVTNVNFEHFWINEGVTTYLERKVIGKLDGEPSRHLHAILKWKDLEAEVESLGPSNHLTALVTNLTTVHPDNALTEIPFEKGSTFLWYLEDVVGGATVFEPFLKSFFKDFSKQSIDSEQFKSYFIKYFYNVEALQTIDWDTWLYKPGMPIYKPQFDNSMAKKCWNLAKKWKQWNMKRRKVWKIEFHSFSPLQKQEFLSSLFNGPPLNHLKLNSMEKLYSLNGSPNYEILFRWIRLGIKARWIPIVQPALKLLSEQGRLKYSKQIFKDLYDWKEMRPKAISTFLAHKDEMSLLYVEIISKMLHLTL